MQIYKRRESYTFAKMFKRTSPISCQRKTYDSSSVDFARLYGYPEMKHYALQTVTNAKRKIEH